MRGVAGPPPLKAVPPPEGVLVTEIIEQEQARFGVLVHAAHSLLVSPPALALPTKTHAFEWTHHRPRSAHTFQAPMV